MVMTYERPLQSVLFQELSRPTPVIHVLIGPRQTGKTTMAHQIQGSIGIPTIYATADSPVALMQPGWKASDVGRFLKEPGPPFPFSRSSMNCGRCAGGAKP